MNIKAWRANTANICTSDVRSQMSEVYLEKRELVWEKKKQTFRDCLWNGRVYTIDRIESINSSLSLYLGQCEYKDIIFKETLGLERIANDFGNNAIVQHLVICVVPITLDGLLVLSEVGDQTIQEQGLIDVFGGSANCDEVTVSCFDDLSKFAFKELNEEAGWSSSSGYLKPWLLVAYNGKFTLFYNFSLYDASTSMKVKLAQAEVASVLLANKNNFFALKNRRCSLEVEVLRHLLKDLKYELEHSSFQN